MVQNQHHAGSGYQARNTGERGEYGGELELFKGLECLAANLGNAGAGGSIRNRERLGDGGSTKARSL